MRTVFPQSADEDLKRAFFADTERGFFVEVGANDPRWISQTFAMEQRGWTGVLVEPQPDLADALRRARTAKVFAVACSSRADAGSHLTLHLAGPQSSFDQRLNSGDVKPHGTLDVPVRTLDDILAEAGATTLDFVSIDVEGHELQVLDGFDLERWRPRLLIVEDLLTHTRLHRHLARRSYRWIRRTGIDNWYVPAGKAESLGLDGTWQFFNKVYLGTPFRRARFAWRRFAASRSLSP